MRSVWKILRVDGAVFLLVVSSLYHNARQLELSVRRYRTKPSIDEISAFEERFAPVHAALSARGDCTVGYLTDTPEANDGWFKEYYRTQYVLAPSILLNSLDTSVVVANLHDRSVTASVLKPKQLVLLKDYGAGVLLASKSSQ